MPNWCYSKTCFDGKPEDIMRLASDIHQAIEYTHRTDYRYCNLWYLLSLNGFDTESYRNRFTKFRRPNFRGSVLENYPYRIDHHGDWCRLYVEFETAWAMDYDILYLMSMIYNVKFHAYSEEPNMMIYSKCRNGYARVFDYDSVIIADWEQLEMSGLDNDIDYATPVFDDRPSTDALLKILDTADVEYERYSIYDASLDGSTLYGVYYDYSYGILRCGVTYGE